jgi:hypothetical protein
MKNLKKEPPKPRDPFLRLKYLGYCLSQMPEKDTTLDEFVEYAKFKLCVKNRVLMKDPIWDSYKKEDILMEFYAHQMEVSDKSRSELEKDLNMEGTAIDDFAEWADKQIKVNKEELQGTMGHEMEDKVSFNPSSIGE